MRGYFRYYSYYYDTEMLQLTVNGKVLDPIYLNVEKAVMLQSSNADSLIILHKSLNCFEISKLDLADFTLSINISIQWEQVNALNAIYFGSNIIIGLGVKGGFKLVKISQQMDHVSLQFNSFRILLILIVYKSQRSLFLLKIPPCM